ARLLFQCQLKVLSDSADLSCQIAEDLLASTQCLPEYTDSQKTPFVDLGIDRAGRDEVKDRYGFASLTIAIDTTYALLHAHRIPRQVVIDDAIAELVIEPLAAHFRRQQHVYRPRIILRAAESVAQLSPLFFRNIAVYQADA